MISAVPKWVMQRYSRLWKKHKDRELSFEEIQGVLKADGRTTISVFLNELKKAGWMDVQLDADDTRKRRYILKHPQDIVEEMNT
jgi:hypothetical protein